MSTSVVADADVETFFRCLSEGSGPHATRVQRRRVAESASTLWRSLVAGTPAAAPTGGATNFRAAKEQGAVLALTTNATTGLLLRPRSLAMPTTLEIGRTTLSETERWKLQAAMRREETKTSGEKYNQNMLRETKTAKPPTAGEAFPAGRGKPQR